MTLEEVGRTILGPALAELPMSMDTPPARIMLLAIGQQESRFLYRRQMGDGPARGFWQFERGGGVRGVMRHERTVAMARDAVLNRGIEYEERPVWEALETDDRLAAIFARLLLFANPKPLPQADEPLTAWRYYLESWRPGKPHPQTWIGFHAAAVEAVRGRP